MAALESPVPFVLDWRTAFYDKDDKRDSFSAGGHSPRLKGAVARAVLCGR